MTGAVGGKPLKSDALAPCERSWTGIGRGCQDVEGITGHALKKNEEDKKATENKPPGRLHFIR